MVSRMYVQCEAYSGRYDSDFGCAPVLFGLQKSGFGFFLFGPDFTRGIDKLLHLPNLLGSLHTTSYHPSQ